ERVDQSAADPGDSRRGPGEREVRVVKGVVEFHVKAKLDALRDAEVLADKPVGPGKARAKHVVSSARTKLASGRVVVRGRDRPPDDRFTGRARAGIRVNHGHEGVRIE